MEKEDCMFKGLLWEFSATTFLNFCFRLISKSPCNYVSMVTKFLKQVCSTDQLSEPFLKKWKGFISLAFEIVLLSHCCFFFFFNGLSGNVY